MRPARWGNAPDMAEHAGADEAAQGTAEGVKGKLKEWWARLTGDRKLAREAKAQQDKGEAQREVAEHEVEQRSQQDL